MRPRFRSGILPRSMRPSAGSSKTIVRRYLRAHALIGLNELTARYPLGPALTATESAGTWVEDGPGLCVRDVLERGWPLRGGRKAGISRKSAGSRSRCNASESVAVAPEVFADMLIRRQGLHPDGSRAGASSLPIVLDQLQGFAATPDCWESEILPGRRARVSPRLARRPAGRRRLALARRGGVRR